MGLVDYSDSESETETVQQKPNPAAAASSKKPFQKLLDRTSGPGKIVVNLSAAGTASDANVEDEQPPAKRVKTAGTSRFSGLGSFLPPPKRAAAAAAAAATPGGSAALGRKSGTAPAPGVHLRTGAEPAFARGGGDGEAADVDGDLAPSSKNRAGPSIPEGQKPEEEVKLVGKPLMFKPLSVARKRAPAKNKKKDTALQTASPSPGAAALQNHPSTTTTPPTASSTAPPPQKKISLFSMGDDEPTPTTNPTTAAAATGSYQPLFTSTEPTLPDEESDVTSAYPTYQPPEPTTQHQQHHHQQQQQHDSLASLTANLSRAAQRELFGRPTSTSTSSSTGPSLPANARVIDFNMEREYAHNEALRQSGAAQPAYNPVRSIAPGKHSLRQVVNMAQSNQDALEESFARAKSSQKDAAGRYGW
ncbi:mitotic checkpoint regulator, MAD2B-interacting-domain-containing protein [Chaetomium fimeti]|uniref:Mitotic checkpoint regulator, MAD2B-interacting-domain-containing protein n=1 Tax=Chaetomium fimeti TaxID=1854472 RepID=A0AAE0HGC0_9PEZI|nr:mitotic checkpoint regulator, MAD2B-interacting-domain-containing protein [Chaetomium fimeti]